MDSNNFNSYEAFNFQHLWSLLLAFYQIRIDPTFDGQIASWYAIAVVISDQ